MQEPDFWDWVGVSPKLRGLIRLVDITIDLEGLAVGYATLEECKIIVPLLVYELSLSKAPWRIFIKTIELRHIESGVILSEIPVQR